MTEPSLLDALRARLRWAIARAVPRMTQQRLETEIGEASGFVSHLLGARGQRLSLDALWRMSRALGVSYAWLACGAGPAWWVVARGDAGRGRTYQRPGGEPVPVSGLRWARRYVDRPAREARAFGGRVVGVRPRS